MFSSFSMLSTATNQTETNTQEYNFQRFKNSFHALSDKKYAVV